MFIEEPILSSMMERVYSQIHSKFSLYSEPHIKIKSMRGECGEFLGYHINYNIKSKQLFSKGILEMENTFVYPKFINGLIIEKYKDADADEILFDNQELSELHMAIIYDIDKKYYPEMPED